MLSVEAVENTAKGWGNPWRTVQIVALGCTPNVHIWIPLAIKPRVQHDEGMAHNRRDQPRSKASHANGVNVPGESETASTRVEVEGKNWREKWAQKLGWGSGKLSEKEEASYAWFSAFLPAVITVFMGATKEGVSWGWLSFFIVLYLVCLVRMFHLASKSTNNSGEDAKGRDTLGRTHWGLVLSILIAAAGLLVGMFLPENSAWFIVSALAIAAVSAWTSQHFFKLYPYLHKRK